MTKLEQLVDSYLADPSLFEDSMFIDVRINREDVYQDMLIQAERFLHWARMSAICDTKHQLTKLDQNAIWAEVYAKAKADLIAGGSKKPTIAEIEAAAGKAPQYITAKQLTLKHEQALSSFRRMESAMWQRKDMLQSLNSRQKEELTILPQDGNDINDLETKAKAVIEQSRGV